MRDIANKFQCSLEKKKNCFYRKRETLGEREKQLAGHNLKEWNFLTTAGIFKSVLEYFRERNKYF